ncbi:MAG: ATP-binding protein [Gemmatales bacterium]|nr:ATP-binding protein [Gemmatales bacterium]
MGEWQGVPGNTEAMLGTGQAGTGEEAIHHDLKREGDQNTAAIVSNAEMGSETIVLKIRWFGVVLGLLWVNLAPNGEHRAMLNGILLLGLGYALWDTWTTMRGWKLMQRYPLVISLLEAIFIGLLCYFDSGLHSPFRYYYLLSLIICALRYQPLVTYVTFGLHSVSFGGLYLLRSWQEVAAGELLLGLVLMGWVAWAADALASWLKETGARLQRLNLELEKERANLEARVQERTRQLQEAQASLLHQEKMAAFGLLAAGIAHEVGNPLACISSLVQLLQRRVQDAGVQEKLALVNEQLQRIQAILRELIDFSRPASRERVWTRVETIIQQALNIAKYYKRTRGKTITTEVAPNLPTIYVVQDQLVQAVLNLVLNAIDATSLGGHIVIRAGREDGELRLRVCDDGPGIRPEDQHKLFQPYFTTKPHGTGLGLFVTQRLVQEHQGRVSFRSEPGRTEFCIHLPLAACLSGDSSCGRSEVLMPLDTSHEPEIHELTSRAHQPDNCPHTYCG